MHRLQTLHSIAEADGTMHVVQLPENLTKAGWLVHSQIELDGKRVFVRMVDTGVFPEQKSNNRIIGLFVSPVY